MCVRAHLVRCFNRFITTQSWNVWSFIFKWPTEKHDCSHGNALCDALAYACLKICLSSQYDDYNSGGFPSGISTGKILSSLMVAVVFRQFPEAFPGTKLPFSENLFHNKLTLPLGRDSFGLVSIWAAFIAPGSTFCPRRWSQLYTLTLHFSNCHYNSSPIWALDLSHVVFSFLLATSDTRNMSPLPIPLDTKLSLYFSFVVD